MTLIALSDMGPAAGARILSLWDPLKFMSAQRHIEMVSPIGVVGFCPLPSAWTLRGM